jgi:hypothetical protein
MPREEELVNYGAITLDPKDLLGRGGQAFVYSAHLPPTGVKVSDNSNF